MIYDKYPRGGFQGMGKRKRRGRILKGTILAILMFIFGCYGLAYCQDSNVMQSVENAKIAWESIFPDNKCILLPKRNDKYETHVYEMKSLKCDVLKTNSRDNPHKLKVRIEIEKWSIKEKQISIKDALANAKEKGDRFPGSGVAELPLTGLYELKKGRWVFSMGNKWMMDFLKKARAKYNQHVNISTIIFIPEK
jgi:hypothetical protein